MIIPHAERTHHWVLTWMGDRLHEYFTTITCTKYWPVTSHDRTRNQTQFVAVWFVPV